MPQISIEVEADLDDIKDEISAFYNPEDIFDDDELDTWANKNGYIKEE